LDKLSKIKDLIRQCSFTKLIETIETAAQIVFHDEESSRVELLELQMLEKKFAQPQTQSTEYRPPTRLYQKNFVLQTANAKLEEFRQMMKETKNVLDDINNL
jgi:hypothetical protein